MKDKQLPVLPIKIIRQDDKIKIDYGGYLLTLKPLKDTTQTYSGLLLDKFLTEVTTKLLQAEIDKQHNKEAAKKALIDLGIDDTESTDNVVKQIHNDLFPGQK